jgi:mortality factor 4-like protein 1
VKLIIPDVLKALLVDDWENITKNNQLVPLPHPQPVSKILEDYSAYETPKRPEGSAQVDILEETLAGLKEYFDKALGRILLYRYVAP